MNAGCLLRRRSRPRIRWWQVAAAVAVGAMVISNFPAMRRYLKMELM